MFSGLQKPLDMGQEDVTWREKACTQPQQLPAFLFTVPKRGEIQEEKSYGVDTALCFGMGGWFSARGEETCLGSRSPLPNRG